VVHGSSNPFRVRDPRFCPKGKWPPFFFVLTLFWAFRPKTQMAYFLYCNPPVFRLRCFCAWGFFLATLFSSPPVWVPPPPQKIRGPRFIPPRPFLPPKDTPVPLHFFYVFLVAHRTLANGDPLYLRLPLLFFCFYFPFLPPPPPCDYDNARKKIGQFFPGGIP